ncbi:MAG: preprotein translocase subunit SecE [Polyangiaceae bacterium]|nr:preprotein translocase subunit SecE [Polyangiaceae bacterium]MCW5792167.1 preprotein translocase subunit SecE [Polyangiaceae bacterium]
MATKDKDLESEDVAERDEELTREDAEDAARADSEGSDDSDSDDEGSEDSDDEGSDDRDSDDEGSDDGDSDGEGSDDEGSDDDGSADDEDEDDGSAVEFGSTRYVHAALFGSGILIAFLSGKLLTSLWNTLAEWPTAVRAVPSLIALSEDERPNVTMALGAVIGAIAIIQIYRKPHVRAWADEVAQELGKVTWPGKQVVVDGTIVVIIASIIATAYIAVLDRFWGFVTGLVYGA